MKYFSDENGFKCAKLLLPWKTVGALMVLAVLCGCKFLLPAHPNSNFRKGESVKLEMLMAKDIKNSTNLLADYVADFGEPPGERQKVVFLPILASAAVGFAVDFVGREMGQEAQQYQAQFSTTRTFTDFWSKIGPNEAPGGDTNDVGGQSQKYYGLRLVRNVDPTNSPNNAFEFVCGWKYDDKARMWMAKPMLFKTSKAKAKVISNKWYHQLLVFPWLLRYPAGQINSEIEIEFVGHLRDIDQMKKDIPMGTLDFKMEAYDMGKCELLEARSYDRFKNDLQGPFVDAPVPVDRSGNALPAANAGVFTVTARVTESDLSNVTNSIQKAAAYLSANKATLQKMVTNAPAGGGKSK